MAYSPLPSAPTRWDIQSLLSIRNYDKDGEYSCVGKTKYSDARRCRNPNSGPDIAEAKRIIEHLSRYQMNDSRLEDRLERLAELLLCRAKHQGQVYKMVDRWYGLMEQEAFRRKTMKVLVRPKTSQIQAKHPGEQVTAADMDQLTEKVQAVAKLMEKAIELQDKQNHQQQLQSQRLLEEKNAGELSLAEAERKIKILEAKNVETEKQLQMMKDQAYIAANTRHKSKKGMSEKSSSKDVFQSKLSNTNKLETAEGEAKDHEAKRTKIKPEAKAGTLALDKAQQLTEDNILETILYLRDGANLEELQSSLLLSLPIEEVNNSSTGSLSRVLSTPPTASLVPATSLLSTESSRTFISYSTTTEITLYFPQLNSYQRLVLPSLTWYGEMASAVLQASLFGLWRSMRAYSQTFMPLVRGTARFIIKNPFRWFAWMLMTMRGRYAGLMV